MRFILASVIVSLLTIALWPWIQQFVSWVHSEYTKVSTFEEEDTVIDEEEKKDE